ncbi:hypothetical protein UU5_11505 [Rhodanobacter sp. 115]|nr:hypothetical protein UU5_11505 [Rhodanobacter sp. 115]
MVAVIVVVIVIAAGGYMAYRAMHPAAPASEAMPATSASAATTPAAEPIQHPISQASAPASASTAPLPALDDSDASVLSALQGLAGGQDLDSLLIHGQIIERIVATVDALPRHALGRSVLPVHAPKGTFAVTQAQGATVMDARNAERYAPYMQLLKGMDSKALVDWYVHAYPLFQQAYRQLGYPKGYFNDRLVTAIDNLLATPDLAQAPALTPVNGHYEYANPALESLSVGQKMLLRAGPADEAAIKAKLRDVRAQLTGKTLPAVK